MNDLSLEKQLTHRTFCMDVDKMSLEQAREFLKKLHLQLLLQQALFLKMERSNLPKPPIMNKDG